MPQEWLKIINQFGGKIPETYGVPLEEIRNGIKHGVRKVNIDTDLRLASTGAIRKLMGEKPDEFDPRKFFAAATKARERLPSITRFRCPSTAGKSRKTPFNWKGAQYSRGFGPVNQLSRLFFRTRNYPSRATLTFA